MVHFRVDSNLSKQTKSASVVELFAHITKMKTAGFGIQVSAVAAVSVIVPRLFRLFAARWGFCGPLCVNRSSHNFAVGLMGL